MRLMGIVRAHALEGEPWRPWVERINNTRELALVQEQVRSSVQVFVQVKNFVQVFVQVENS